MMRFDVVKTIRVPVPEPRRVALANGASARSLERWIVAPGDFMGVVFTADAVAEIEENLWRIQVLKLPLLEWELNPEFDLTVLDPSRAKRPGGVKMVCEDALRLEPASASASAFAAAADADADASPRSRLPPGFDSMEIWSHIDCELYVARGRGGVGGGGAVRGTTAVCADLRVTVAADIPWGLRAVPYFDKIGEAAIGASIDVVANGAQERVQRAFEAWVEEGEAEVEGAKEADAPRRREVMSG